MLKITGIEIENFGRHKHVAKTFEGHVVGLCGPNGRGKTTVLDALELGFTGNIVHPDPLNAFIRRSGEAKPPKKARVKVTFEADGKKGHIVREITKTTTSREMVWDGYNDGKPLSADKAVSDLLFQILGVDKKAINSTVFIKQGEMAKMFGDPTERRDFYTKLLMLGHLGGIANVVDNFRKQVADSCVDLGALKDAADTAYNEAAEHFETSDAALKLLTPQQDNIDAALALVRLFNEQASAEQAGVSAEAAMAAATAADAAGKVDPARITALEQLIETIGEERKANAKKWEQFRAVDQKKRMLTEANTKFTVLDAAEAALFALPADDSPDPAIKVKQYQETLKKWDRLDEVKALLVTFSAYNEAMEQASKAAQEENEAARADSLTILERRAPVLAQLDLRMQLRNAMQKEADGCTAECPVCGSGSIASGYLDTSIAELQAAVAEIEVERAPVLARVEASLAAAYRARAAADNAKRQADEHTAEMKKLTVELLLAGERIDLKAALDAAEAEVQPWTIRAHERKRAEAAVTAAKVAVRNLTRPDILEINNVTFEFDTLQGQCVTWDPARDNEETTAKAELAALNRRLTAHETAAAAMRAAADRLTTAEAALRASLDKLPTTNPDLSQRLSEGGAITAVSIVETGHKLRAEQSAYDAAKGALDSARTSLKAASAKVSELDLKIAEQGQRRKLVEDLVKLRDTFKPSGASLEYLDYKFGQIARMAADYLAESEANFMVTASTEIPLAFEFLRLDRPDEVWLPQSRMSGGQKVRLSVATLRAIHALIMPNVGLLVLDEPTTHLDDDAKRSMAEMLRKIGEEGTLQMIVCDHSPVLIDAFSDIIELPE